MTKKKIPILQQELCHRFCVLACVPVQPDGRKELVGRHLPFGKSSGVAVYVQGAGLDI